MRRVSVPATARALAAPDNARMAGFASTQRRDMLRAGLALAGSLTGVGCAQPAPRSDWAAQLSGPTLALLGEVHDNPEHHRLRAAALQQAFERGWRPAVV